MHAIDLSLFAASLATDLIPFAGTAIHVFENGQVYGKSVDAGVYCAFELAEIGKRYEPGVYRIPEVNQRIEVNPFSRQGWNLTAQCQMSIENPAKAAQLRIRP